MAPSGPAEQPDAKASSSKVPRSGAGVLIGDTGGDGTLDGPIQLVQVETLTRPGVELGAEDGVDALELLDRGIPEAPPQDEASSSPSSMRLCHLRASSSSSGGVSVWKRT